MSKISNWGNYPVVDADVVSFSSAGGLQDILKKTPETIVRGLGRCYGDSALNTHIISMRRLNRILAFDESTGTVTCESGVSLKELLDVFVPRGWFLPTTPGTKHVTVGGAIASDVHGKNHHTASSFARHVLSMELMLADGSIVTCSETEQKELFRATAGGMGLTGVILSAVVRLQKVESAFIRSETVKARDLKEIMDLFESSAGWTYSVAWMDCLATGEKTGRSILNRGEHAVLSDLVTTDYYRRPLEVTKKMHLSVPFHFPGFTLNRQSMNLFNALYYAKTPENTVREIVDYNTFFYPLDGIENWNKVYGKRGFTQYQFVLPKNSSAEGLQAVLKKAAEKGTGPFLAVLKLFGKQEGMLSFPKEGYTLALDFPVNPENLVLFDELDSIVRDHEGRLYLTKDVRMSNEMFLAGYTQADEFRKVKRTVDAKGKFQSLQSKRIGI